MRHCLDTIRAIVEAGRDDRRAILQLGYNLGRLSELSGLGRAPFWDAWKGPVETWDVARLLELAHELPHILNHPPARDESPEPPGPPQGLDPPYA